MVSRAFALLNLCRLGFGSLRARACVRFVKRGFVFGLALLVTVCPVPLRAQTQHGAAAADQELVLPKPRPVLGEEADAGDQDAPLFPATVESNRFMRIATGPVRGGYFGVGGAICDLINADAARHRIECLVRPTQGSAENISRVLRGGSEFGLVQSDWQSFAVTSLDARAESDLNFDRLRAVAALYPLALQVVVREGVGDVRQLAGLDLGLPPSGSGQRQLIDVVLTQAGLRPRDFDLTPYASDTAMARAFCGGALDAFFVVGPAPMASIELSLSRCGGQLLSLDDSLVTTLIGDRDALAPLSLGPGSYPDQRSEIATLGFIVTLVTSEGLDDSMVAEVARHLDEGAQRFSRSHPALSAVDGSAFFEGGLTAPMHNGVVRYLDSISPTGPVGGLSFDAGEAQGFEVLPTE